MDGSGVSRDALRWALDEARLRKSTLRAVHAWQPYTVLPGYGQPEDFEPGELSRAAAEHLHEVVAEVAAESDGVTVDEVVIEGPPASVLVDAAEGADMLVVGSRGLGGFAGLLVGSVSQQCAQHAPCPVLIFRSSAAPEPVALRSPQGY